MKVIKGDLLDAARKIEQPPLRRNFTEYLTYEDKHLIDVTDPQEWWSYQDEEFKDKDDWREK